MTIAEFITGPGQRMPTPRLRRKPATMTVRLEIDIDEDNQTSPMTPHQVAEEVRKRLNPGSPDPSTSTYSPDCLQASVEISWHDGPCGECEASPAEHRW